MFCNFAYNQGVSAKAIPLEFSFPLCVGQDYQLIGSKTRANSESTFFYGLRDYRLV